MVVCNHILFFQNGFVRHFDTLVHERSSYKGWGEGVGGVHGGVW